MKQIILALNKMNQQELIKLISKLDSDARVLLRCAIWEHDSPKEGNLF